MSIMRREQKNVERAIRGCLFAALFCLLLPTGAAEAVDFAALAGQLDSEQFREREAAEQAIVAGGLKIVSAAFAAAPLPENATADQTDRHFARLEADLRSVLHRQVYRHLDERTGLEARYRAERVRLAIDRRLLGELARAQVGLSKRLSADIVEKVYGYTGGFRDGTTWFDAEYGNNSQLTVSSIRILVRLTHKRTGEKTEKEVVLASPAGPLRPGEKAVWSADVGMSYTSEHDFYWETRAVFGTLPAPPPSPDLSPRSTELP
jgi:hypothetical protein